MILNSNSNQTRQLTQTPSIQQCGIKPKSNHSDDRHTTQPTTNNKQQTNDQPLHFTSSPASRGSNPQPSTHLELGAHQVLPNLPIMVTQQQLPGMGKGGSRRTGIRSALVVPLYAIYLKTEPTSRNHRVAKA